MNWKTTQTIAARQFRSYFQGPVAIIVVTAVLLFIGFFFWSRFFLIERTSIRPMFEFYSWAMMFAAPAISMGLLADEKRQGTIELLITMPIRELEVIIGKYVAAVGLLTVMLLCSFPFVFSVASLGDLDWGPVWTGYLGMFLQGAAMIAIGIAVSSVTDNQLVAFFVGLFVCLFFVMIYYLLPFVPTVLLTLAELLSFGIHVENFAKGVLDSRDFIYFFTIVFLGLMIAYRSLESRRWA